MKKRDRMVEAAIKSFDALSNPLRKACDKFGYPEEFLVALCATSALATLGYTVRLAAGSARWRVMGDEEQGEALLTNKKIVPYFGYKFDLCEELPTLVKMEYPDNLHAWCVTRSGVIYDFTGKHQLEAFAACNATEWPEATKLPPVICGSPQALRLRGWEYMENEKASQFVSNMVMRVIMLSAQPPFTNE